MSADRDTRGAAGAPQRRNRYLLPVFAIFTGIMNFTGMELVNGDLARMKFPLGIGNLLLIYFLMLAAFSLTNSLKAGILIPTVLLFLFTLANYFVNLFRGVPLLAPDLLVIRTALSVAGQFKYTPEPRLWLYIGFVAAVTAGVFFIPEDLRLRGKRRRSCIAIFLLLLALVFYLFAFSDSLARAGVTVSHFNPVRSYAENGSLLTFIRSAQMIRQDKPDGYSPEKVEQIAAPYVERSAEDEDYREPNVIVMMNEAFADVQSIGAPFSASIDVMPVIHGLKENTIKGTAFTSVFGGYTANSEYEFLTGNSMAGLGGVAPFQFLIKRPMCSLATLLKSRGYSGLLAIHPYLRNGYQRPLAYKNLGFSDFLGLEDMKDREHEYLRDYISDSDDVKEIIASYEKIRREESSKPVFIYNVTMQNHAPFDGVYDNFSADVTVLDEGLASDTLENYLSLVKRSDAALGELIDYFSEVEEDTVIIFFGDHEPKLGNSFYKKVLGKKVSALNAEESMSRYQVPYVIWANYDIEDQNYGEISLNYLSALAMKATGMKLSPFQQYLLDLREEIPVITAQGYWDKEHVFHETDEADSFYRQRLLEYRYIQYNNLTDGKHRIDHFFE